MDLSGPYIVVGSESAADLMHRVGRYMTQGYQPLGGVSVTSRTYLSRDEWHEELCFAQAMILVLPPGF